MSDPVGEALRAAVDAGMHSRGISPNDLDAPEFEVIVAAAVPKFLRVLADEGERDGWSSMFTGRLRGMALAVERAAMGERG